MPRGDRIGPFGQGPKTGRGAGYCANNDIPGYMNTSLERGLFGRMRKFFGNRDFGSGFSGGRGRRGGRFGVSGRGNGIRGGRGAGMGSLVRGRGRS